MKKIALSIIYLILGHICPQFDSDSARL